MTDYFKYEITDGKNETSILEVFEGVVTKTDEAIRGITRAMTEFMKFNVKPNFCIEKIQFDMLEDRINPVVSQSDAKTTTISGEKMKICKGVTNRPDDYVYYGDTPEFIKDKTYPYGNW